MVVSRTLALVLLLVVAVAASPWRPPRRYSRPGTQEERGLSGGRNDYPSHLPSSREEGGLLVIGPPFMMDRKNYPSHLPSARGERFPEESASSESSVEDSSSAETLRSMYFRQHGPVRPCYFNVISCFGHKFPKKNKHFM